MGRFEPRFAQNNYIRIVFCNDGLQAIFFGYYRLCIPLDYFKLIEYEGNKSKRKIKTTFKGTM